MTPIRSGPQTVTGLGRRSRRDHGRIASGAIEERNEFLRRAKWRTRTTPARRNAAAVVTFGVYLAVGLAIVSAIMWVLGAIGAPRWVVALPWLFPTLVVLVWNQRRPGPAIPTDDDDDSWTGYSVRYVLVGAGEPRPRLARLVAALLFGAPVGWAFFVLLLIELAGIV